MQNARPVAHAGPNLSVTENTSVVLDGSASYDPDGTLISFAWRQTSGTPGTFQNADQARATFTAPSLSSSTAETLYLVLEVTDNDGGTHSDVITVQVEPAPNASPVADAGPDQSVRPAASVVLDGSASYDPDGTLSTFQWVQMSGRHVYVHDWDRSQARFTTRSDAVEETLEFELRITDNRGAFASDRVTVQVTPNTPNIPPVAIAGPDYRAMAGTSINLDGSASYDPDGVLTSFAWVQAAGSTVALENADQAQASFTAPSVTAEERLEFVLTVSDEDGASASDTVTVAVLVAPKATTYEDAEDGTTDGWGVYDATPDGAAIANVFDTARNSRVIELAGTGTQNGFRLRAENGSLWYNTSATQARWSFNIPSAPYHVYIDIETDEGRAYMHYRPSTRSPEIAGASRPYYRYSLDPGTADGQWHTLTRDLEADLKGLDPDRELVAVRGFLFRGNGRFDDIELLETPIPAVFEDVYEDAEDGMTDGWGVYDATPDGAAIANVFDSARDSQVIELTGAGTENGFRLRNADNSLWSNTEATLAHWSLNVPAAPYNVYIDIETDEGRAYMHYRTGTRSPEIAGASRPYYRYSLDPATANGQWHTLTRDLEADLQGLDPDRELLAVHAFLFRGSGRVDDIALGTRP